MKDGMGRNIDYMRISVTQRCNLRCLYCMPEDAKGAPESGSLKQEDMVRFCFLAARLGIDRFKLTGGEPLLYPELPQLVRALYERAMAGEVTLTTNGILLAGRARELKEAGIRSVNVSLDTLKEQRYEEICRRPGLDRVLQGVEKALSLDFQVKINCTLLSGVNEDEIEDFLRFSGQYGTPVRFIELMPLGEARGYRGVGREEVWERAVRLYPGSLFEPVSSLGNGPAEYWRIPQNGAVIGFVSPMSHRFCASCNRLRLTGEGRLMNCLDGGEGWDVRASMQRGASDGELMEGIRACVREKPAGHHFERPDQGTGRSRFMNRIGG